VFGLEHGALSFEQRAQIRRPKGGVS